jgi:membrane associated rhomboid family serine protease
MRVTTVLILLCFALSLYAWTANPVVVQNDLVFSLGNLLAGRVWTVVTAIFVHANLLHLLGNMIFLYVFGNTLEGVADSKRMLLAFFLEGS